MLVSEDPGLWESVHAAMDLTVYIYIVDNCQQVVGVNDGGRYDGDRDPKVLIAVKWRAEVKIAEVTTHGSRVRRGDGAVHDHFGCTDCHGYGADVAWVIDAITADYATSAAGIVDLLWSIIDDNPAVCDISALVCRNVLVAS